MDEDAVLADPARAARLRRALERDGTQRRREELKLLDFVEAVRGFRARGVQLTGDLDSDARAVAAALRDSRRIYAEQLVDAANDDALRLPLDEAEVLAVGRALRVPGAGAPRPLSASLPLAAPARPDAAELAHTHAHSAHAHPGAQHSPLAAPAAAEVDENVAAALDTFDALASSAWSLLVRRVKVASAEDHAPGAAEAWDVLRGRAAGSGGGSRRVRHAANAAAAAGDALATMHSNVDLDGVVDDGDVYEDPAEADAIAEALGRGYQDDDFDEDGDNGLHGEDDNDDNDVDDVDNDDDNDDDDEAVEAVEMDDDGEEEDNGAFMRGDDGDLSASMRARQGIRDRSNLVINAAAAAADLARRAAATLSEPPTPGRNGLMMEISEFRERIEDRAVPRLTGPATSLRATIRVEFINLVGVADLIASEGIKSFVLAAVPVGSDGKEDSKLVRRVELRRVSAAADGIAIGEALDFELREQHIGILMRLRWSGSHGLRGKLMRSRMREGAAVEETIKLKPVREQDSVASVASRAALELRVSSAARRREPLTGQTLRKFRERFRGMVGPEEELNAAWSVLFHQHGETNRAVDLYCTPLAIYVFRSSSRRPVALRIPYADIESARRGSTSTLHMPTAVKLLLRDGRKYILSSLNHRDEIFEAVTANIARDQTRQELQSLRQRLQQAPVPSSVPEPEQSPSPVSAPPSSSPSPTPAPESKQRASRFEALHGLHGSAISRFRDESLTSSMKGDYSQASSANSDLPPAAPEPVLSPVPESEPPSTALAAAQPAAVVAAKPAPVVAPGPTAVPTAKLVRVFPDAVAEAPQRIGAAVAGHVALLALLWLVGCPVTAWAAVRSILLLPLLCSATYPTLQASMVRVGLASTAELLGTIDLRDDMYYAGSELAPAAGLVLLFALLARLTLGTIVGAGPAALFYLLEGGLLFAANLMHVPNGGSKKA